jgi:hypothetical protein
MDANPECAEAFQKQLRDFNFFMKGIGTLRDKELNHLKTDGENHV